MNNDLMVVALAAITANVRPFVNDSRQFSEQDRAAAGEVNSQRWHDIGKAVDEITVALITGRETSEATYELLGESIAGRIRTRCQEIRLAARERKRARSPSG